MGTNIVADSTAEALFGKVRRGVLGLFFGAGEEEHHLSEVVRRVGAGRGAVQRELERLVAAGLLERRSQGNLALYAANPRAPVYDELRALMRKTVGLVGVLASALEPLAERVRVAVVFGSFARGADTVDSDVDLLVVGDVELDEVAQCVWSAQEQLGREVNPVVFPPDEFRARADAGDHLVGVVTRGPRLLVMGDEHELARLAGARPGD